MKEVILTGAAGFIGSYIAQELLARGYKVYGYDNYSKYGEIRRPQDSHPNYICHRHDLAHYLLPDLPSVDYIVHCCAVIGGIRLFNRISHDLFSANARIDANVFESAIRMLKHGRLKRIIVMSSSMVFEGCDKYNEHLSSILYQYGADWGRRRQIKDMELSPWPSKEELLEVLPPPVSAYGRSKLNTETSARSAWEQYRLPYTIIRPYNATGLGEEDALGDSHVLPDLVYKCLSDPDNFSLLGDGTQQRCFTHSSDIARGVVDAMESDAAINNDFNISVAEPTSIGDLARMVWRECWPDREFKVKYEPALPCDVQVRIPNTSKASRVLGFKPMLTIKDAVKELVPWMRARMDGSK